MSVTMTPSATISPHEVLKKYKTIAVVGVEIVDVFRPSEELPQVAQQVVDFHRKYGRPFAFWAQLGLENNEAKEILAKNKIPYIMNACLRIVQKSL